jgi:hypothetical protein
VRTGPLSVKKAKLTTQPIWGISGIAYGMVELIRRVIPADICGGDVLRLRRMGMFPKHTMFLYIV